MYYMTTEYNKKERRNPNYHGCIEGFNHTLHICCFTGDFISNDRPVNCTHNGYSYCINVCR